MRTYKWTEYKIETQNNLLFFRFCIIKMTPPKEETQDDAYIVPYDRNFEVDYRPLYQKMNMDKQEYDNKKEECNRLM